MVCLLNGMGALRFTTSAKRFGFSVRVPIGSVRVVAKDVLRDVFEYLLVASGAPKEVQEALRRNEETIRAKLEN